MLPCDNHTPFDLKLPRVIQLANSWEYRHCLDIPYRLLCKIIVANACSLNSSWWLFSSITHACCGRTWQHKSKWNQYTHTVLILHSLSNILTPFAYISVFSGSVFSDCFRKGLCKRTRRSYITPELILFSKGNFKALEKRKSGTEYLKKHNRMTFSTETQASMMNPFLSQKERYNNKDSRHSLTKDGPRHLII